MFGEDEIQSMLDDVGLPITINGVVANGSVRRADQEMLQVSGFEKFIGKAIVVLVYTPFAAALSVGDQVLVDGAAFKAYEILQSANGIVTKILCTIDPTAPAGAGMLSFEDSIQPVGG